MITIWPLTSRHHFSLFLSHTGEIDVDAGTTARTSQFYKFDIAESRLLQDRYGLRTGPCYLFYYAGKLVCASSSFGKLDKLSCKEFVCVHLYFFLALSKPHHHHHLFVLCLFCVLCLTSLCLYVYAHTH